MEHLYALPLYKQLAIVLLVGTYLLCPFCYVCGSLFRGIPRHIPSLPPEPIFRDSAFPTFWDKAYTLLYTAFFCAMVLWNLTHTAQAAGGEADWGSVYACLLMTAPMMLRLLLLKGSATTGDKWWKALIVIPVTLVVVMLVFALLGGIHFTQWIETVTGSPAEQDVVSAFRSGSDKTKLVIAVSACIVAPITEECFFRGFIYNILKGKSGVVAAALCSSILFGAVHGALAQLIPLSLVGLALCYIYERFQTLLAPIAFHALFNSLNLAALFFDVLPS